MEISIYALEKLIAKYEENVANASKQLRDVESGKIQLSPLKLASVENTMEHSQTELTKYKEIYDAIPEKEKDKYRELQKLQDALAKQSYYKLQKIRLKRSSNIDRNQKLEAMMVIDELPDEVHFDDQQLVEVSQEIIKYNVREVSEVLSLINELTQEFINTKDKIKDNEDLKSHVFLDQYIPVVVMYFKILFEDIKNSIEEYNELASQSESEMQQKAFNGFPKYEDWWINELFKNHHAYFSLFQWKTIIEDMCLTDHQKIIWEKLFDSWVAVKQILNTKEENSFDYNLIFDDMLEKHAEFYEELDSEKLESMAKQVKGLVANTDFLKPSKKHETVTVYAQWKQSKKASQKDS